MYVYCKNIEHEKACVHEREGERQDERERG